MSAQLMGLVRELKALNARKKAGETLSAAEETRRKELKVFLKTQLEGGGDVEASATTARPTTTTTTAPAPVAAPAPAPAPPREQPTQSVPRPATMASAPPTAPARPPPPAPKPLAPAYVPKKDQFAIGGSAAALIDAAMGSDAVAKVDPWANRKARANQAELDDAEARAEAAIKATKKRERAQTPEEVLAQIRETQGGYTPPSDDYCQEQYYGDYYGEGLLNAAVAEAGDLKPIDPREIEVRRAIDIAAGPSGGGTSMTIPPGLMFLDDFVQLYAKRVLPPPGEEVSFEVDDPTMLIGKRKVTVHLINGEKKQGTVKALRRGELGFKLEGAGVVEEIAISQVKAVFVHLQTNAQPKPSVGRSVTVMFRDQRAVQGDSDDYAPGALVFTLIPPAGRGQFDICNSGIQPD